MTPVLHEHVVYLPLRLQSVANLREHHFARHTRVKGERQYVFYALKHDLAVVCPYTLPLTITLTRLAPRRLDSGNLEACFKGVQDGVADYLYGKYGAGQDRQPGLTWRYAQRSDGPRVYALEVTFSPGEPV